MKANILMLLFLLSTMWTYKSCYYKLECDDSDSVKLGTIDYSPKFKAFNIEDTQDSLVFKSMTQSLTFIRKPDTDPRPRRCNEYIVCEKVDVKPQYAYAYYEYPNRSSLFLTDGAVLSIDPDISKVGDEKGESLYIGVSINTNTGLKGRVPISHIDTTITYQPFGELFKYHSQIELEGQELNNIWVFKKQNNAIYYSKDTGIVALENNGEIYFRK